MQANQESSNEMHALPGEVQFIFVGSQPWSSEEAALTAMNYHSLTIGTVSFIVVCLQWNVHSNTSRDFILSGTL